MLALSSHLPGDLFSSPKRYHLRLAERVRGWDRPVLLGEGFHAFVAREAVKIRPVVTAKTSQPAGKSENKLGQLEYCTSTGIRQLCWLKNVYSSGMRLVVPCRVSKSELLAAPESPVSSAL